MQHESGKLSRESAQRYKGGVAAFLAAVAIAGCDFKDGLSRSSLECEGENPVVFKEGDTIQGHVGDGEIELEEGISDAEVSIKVLEMNGHIEDARYIRPGDTVIFPEKCER